MEVGSFERAVWSVETLDPGGEIWINGRVVEVSRNRHPLSVEVGDYLREGETNQIAVKVNAFKSPDERYWHPPQDPYIGWFAGRMSLDLTDEPYISDVFAYCNDVSDPASMQTNVTVQKDHGNFMGSLKVEYFPWYPPRRRPSP